MDRGTITQTVNCCDFEGYGRMSVNVNVRPMAVDICVSEWMVDDSTTGR